MTHPRGRLPAKVYWVRRGGVVVVAFALVFGIAHLLGGGGSDQAPSARMAAAPKNAGQPTPPKPTLQGPQPVQTLPSGPHRHQKRHHQGKHAQPSDPASPSVPLASPTGTCNPGDLSATPTIDSAAAGRKIDISLQISGTAAACTFKVSPASLVLKVTSGPDNVWSSQQCRKAVPRETAVVRNAKPARLSVQWDGHRSTEGHCGASNPWAEPGYYHAHAAVLGSVPSDQPFQLTVPPRKVITKTAHPKPQHDTTGSQGNGTGVHGKQSTCGGDNAC